MNRIHRRYCAGRRWAGYVRGEMVPEDLQEVELGDDVLEIGPGPGLTTEMLKERVPKLTAIEIEAALAQALRERMASERVEIVCGDASAMPFQNDRFSAAVCFTMLHHVPTRELQDRIFAEARRVLRPGGVFVGSDSNPSRWNLGFRLFHVNDTMNLVPPDTLGERLETAGFHSVEVRRRGDRVWWRARA